MDSQRPPRGWNLPLIGGLGLLGLIVAAALIGPLLVRDPLERTLIAEINGSIRGTPFPPFGSWEFPLGSDRYGRDLLARLLHGIRPTLLLVLLIGSVRLVIGVIIGIAAARLDGLFGAASRRLLQAAVSVPVLITALAGITAVGIERGLIAFLVGMTLTGWADTAQVVRAQTQRIAALPFIEAARALGANEAQIIVRHLLRHITPLLLILLAAELSAAMLLTAALAFLGYFIGGGVWVIMAGELIPIASRVAGPPELGQLVGTAPRGLSIAPPWEMIFPATVMILTTLSFSLIGEGLRRRITARETVAAAAQQQPARFEPQLISWLGRPSAVLTGRLLSTLLVIAALTPVMQQLTRLPAAPAVNEPAAAAPALPRDHPWQSERADAAGTRSVAALPATAGELQRVTLALEPIGSPVIAADGSLVLTGRDGRLLLLNPDLSVRTEVTLGAPAAGAAALAADGTIYVAARDGSLTAYTADGTQRWQFRSRYRSEASSGPVVAADGTVYYAILDAVQAVNPDGSEKWLAADRSLPYIETAPRVSADGSLIFLRNTVFRAEDGARLVIKPVADEPVFAEPLIVVGVDGQLYYRSEHRLLPWQLRDNRLAIAAARGWPAGSVFFYARETGVTVDGTAWWIYSTDYADTRLIWSDAGSQLRGERLIGVRGAQLIAVDTAGALLICGRGSGTVCGVYDAGSGDTARWSLRIGTQAVSGGAVVGDRIYLLLENGELVVLGPTP
jgi:peptide/nickel transport system permease protein